MQRPRLGGGAYGGLSGRRPLGKHWQEDIDPVLPDAGLAGGPSDRDEPAGAPVSTPPVAFAFWLLGLVSAVVTVGC
ncbi:hypothetical protein NDU88_004697 [Pleurodeles waltl]|uniref:Uncharacterized protein n=1 Tax=Pleurodeles waltl TaxID=8319 RepID=A0AAV7MER4_PLEWA|nr:hypothetical protein NDU88_004697 [Pleurodeles waltl]